MPLSHDREGRQTILFWLWREWGRITELACTYGVSRTFLYDLRERAFEGLAEGLPPR